MIDETQPVAAASSAPVSAPATPAASAARPAASGQGRPGQGGSGRFGGGQRGGQNRGGQRGGQNRGGGQGRGGQGRGRRDGDVPAESDYEEKNLEVARVTRVTKGGKRMRFRVLSVIGNRKGRVGFGLAKGVDVAGASGKSTTQARKSLITVPLVQETIPHAVSAKFRAAHILLKPAPKGTGVRAGGAIRPVLEMAGIPNVVSKMLGSSNKVNNVKATIMALKQLRVGAKKGESAEKSETSAPRA